MPFAIFTQKCTQSEGAMGGLLFFDRYADSERMISLISKRSKALTKSSRAGKQINNSKTSRQNELQDLFKVVVYQVHAQRPGAKWLTS